MKSVGLVAFGIILIIVGATSPLYVMLLSAEDDTVTADEDSLIEEAEDTGAEVKCLEGKFAIPLPDSSLFWQEAMLCGKDMSYWMGGGEPPGPIINRPSRDFD